MTRTVWMGFAVVFGVAAVAGAGCTMHRQAKIEAVEAPAPDLTTRLASLEDRLETLEGRQREIEQKAGDVQYLKGKVEGTSSPQIRQIVVTGGQEAGAGGAASQPTPKQIQLALRQAGFYSGKIDGKIGPQTTQAVREFQRQHDLKADGKVGPRTWAVLRPYFTGE